MRANEPQGCDRRAVREGGEEAPQAVLLVAQEVWVDPDHRVDFVAFSPGSGGRNAALEHGRFVFVEVKSCMADFKSGHGLTFHGDQNWLVCPRDLAHELYDKRSCRSACRSTAPTAAVPCGLRMTFRCKPRRA